MRKVREKFLVEPKNDKNSINLLIKDIQSESGFYKLLTNISLITSVKKVFDTNMPESELRCLHALRFISLSWVILGNSISFYMNNLFVALS
jgi:hypothetical protein